MREMMMLLSRMTTVFRLIGKAFKSKFFWFILVMLTSFLVWKGGGMVGIPEIVRIVIIVAIVLLALVIFVMKKVKAKKNAGNVESFFQKQASAQQLNVKPSQRGEYDEINKKFMEALQVLKSKTNRDALATLPWFVFIGPPSAGKTTAIEHSGLKFPVGKSDYRGIGGTRNCEFYFANQGIFLDTAGRWMTEEDDKEEWNTFLDMLSKHRKNRPVNGILLGVSIEDFLDADREEIEELAKDLRHRIVELIEKLQFLVPVYVLFTKCDLIGGFNRFFESLTIEQRNQVWGYTLPIDVVQNEEFQPQDVFNREFDNLIQTLEFSRLERLSTQMRAKESSSVYIFPFQFSILKDGMSYFIERLFEVNVYEKTPYFRGLYFTSGTQEGIPILNIIDRVQGKYGFSQAVEDAFEIKSSHTDTRPYFIRDLFMRIIIPDKDISRPLTARSVFEMRFKVGAVLSALIIMVFSLFWTFQAGLQSGNITGNAKEISEELKDVSTESKLTSSYREISNLRERYSNNFFMWGLGREAPISAVEEMYNKKLIAIVIKGIYKGEIEKKLRAYRQSQKNVTFSPYDYLKAYLLMGTEEYHRLEESPDASFLEEQLWSLYQAKQGLTEPEEEPDVAPEDSATVIPEAKPESITQEVFQRYIQELYAGNIDPFENDLDLVKEVRKILVSELTIDNMYTNLINSTPSAFKNFTLWDGLGDRYSAIFQGTDEALGAFTKRAWEEHVEKAIERLSEAQGSDWVLALDKDSLPKGIPKDPEQLAEKLVEKYFSDYIKEWQDYLKGVKYKSARSISTVAENLNVLGDTGTPLVTLLRNVANQTTFDPDLPTIPYLEKYMKRKEHPVNRSFGDLHKLVEEKSKLADACFKLYELGGELDGLSGDAAKEFALSAIQNNGPLPETFKTVNRLKFYSNGRKAIFENPLTDIVWPTVRGAATSHLNDIWHQDVYSEFKNSLSDKYPFNPEGDDAIISDVERFLGKDGVLRKFYDDEIGAFVRWGSWKSNISKSRWGGLGLPSRSKKALGQVSAIQTDFFKNRDFGIEFTIQEKTDKHENLSEGQGKPIFNLTFLSIDGTSLKRAYEGPVKRKSFNWPGEGDASARLEIKVKQENTSNVISKELTHTGQWAWIRLMREARYEQEPYTDRKGNRKMRDISTKIRWYFDLDYTTVIITYDISPSNPFYQGSRLYGFQCPKSIF
ncbi:MAG: hypothetical protein B6244_03975 [Candidatus Cloacimonetes bacterium 4572_55]|nr:MAG: hypothetical protein B6244_03975 [Candidatus Cloacimonetes bacterium 4572_55]